MQNRSWMFQSKMIPETERAKYTRDPPDGEIHHNFVIIDYDGAMASSNYEIGGLKWWIGVDKRSLDGKDFLFVELDCCDFLKSPPWNIELTAEFIIQHDEDDDKNVSQMHHYIIRDFTKDIGCYLVPWEEMMDEKNGLITYDQISVLVRLTILRGLRCNPAFEFSSSGDIRSDVVLMIEGEPVYVNKHYLGLYSPVFQAMFFGEFAEKGKDEIELKDVDLEEFICLLEVIYPCQKTVTEYTAESLIKLADRFQIPSVINRAEDVLISTDLHTPIEKMRIADQYSLYRLLEHCLSALKRTKHFKTIKDDPIYEDLSDATKAALFERMVEVTR